MKCPFCEYVRSEKDDGAPEWECPSCKKAYAKHSQIRKVNVENAPAKSNLESFLEDKGVLILVSFLCIGFIVTAFYEVEHNWLWSFSITNLFLPILLVSLYIGLFLMPLKRAERGWFHQLWLYFIIAVGATFSSWGYILLYNAYIGVQHVAPLTGEIVRLRRTSYGKHGEFVVTIKNDYTAENIELTVDVNEYRTLQKGEWYDSEWHIGSLGLLYK